MSNVTSGKLLKPGSAEAFPASAQLREDGSLELCFPDHPHLNHKFSPNTFEFGPTIPGLAVDVLFQDGAVFTPEDASFRWRHARTRNQGIISFLERNILIVVLATVLTPLAFWWIVTGFVPKMVDSAVVLVPEPVTDRMGKDTLYLLEKIHLDDSELSEDEKTQVANIWEDALEKLNMPADKYKLHFYKSESIGANAFALPNGYVIVTDDIVKLLADKPDAMLSVLLHEIGHVEHKHSLRLVGRSLTTSIIFAVFLGDIEGIGEMVIGAGASLLDFSFSRNMETEADEYSFEHLETLGVSPAVFAEAMEALIDDAEKRVAENAEDFVSQEGAPGEDEENSEPEEEFNLEWAKYLSTHPMVQERIKAARERGEKFRMTN